jgi:hypothetical protein
MMRLEHQWSTTCEDERISRLVSDVRRGDVGVFAGDWNWIEIAGIRRQPIGYLGVLEDTWDGWAVFSCTRDVAHAIIADHWREVDRNRDRMRRRGLHDEDLDAWVAANTTRMHFDGNDIVVDERGLYHDIHAFRRIKPDWHGRYVINGYLWPWTAINATDCDHIVGEWPA